MSVESKNKRRNVMLKAWELIKSAGLSFKQAIKQAWAFFNKPKWEEVALAFAYFKITFTKKDTGEVAERIGSNAKIREEEQTLQFFSITDNGFRKAIIENILCVEAVNVDFQIS